MSEISPIDTFGVALMERDVAGIRVALLYEHCVDAVFVHYSNADSGEAFVAEVPKSRALHAYHHPLAYGGTRADARQALSPSPRA